LSVVVLAFSVGGGALAEEPEAPRRSLREVIENLPFGLHGFFEARAGARTQGDRRISKTATIGESRLQLELSKVFEIGDYSPEVRVKGDLRC